MNVQARTFRMKSKRARILGIVLCCGALRAQTVLAQPSSADPAAAPVDTTVEAGANDARRREAATHFRMGVSLYEEGDFQAALAEFERANESAPSPVVLYNIAQTHLAMRDYVAATDALRRYLELGGDRITPERRAEVDSQLQTLAMRVGRINVVCNEDGASISIDGRPMGRTPLSEPLRVSSGRHQLVVRAAGREPNEQTVTVAGNTDITVEVEFAPLPPEVSPAATEEPVHTLRTVGWVTIGVGVASAVAAGTTFGLSMGARSDYDAEAESIPVDEAAALDARDRWRRLSLASDVMTGLAIVGGGVGLTLVLLDGRGDDEERADQASVFVAPTPSGVVVSGRF